MTVPIQEQPTPILLFDDECGVCRRIAGWVRRSARLETGQSSIVVRPIGSDPGALRSLNPDLDIWTAYATIHVVMPDGSMKLGGEAIAEVLRSLPRAKWFAWSFAIAIFGFRPFQMLLNLAYAVLADVRPIFGCESCGTPSPWMKPIHWMLNWGKVGASPTPHFTWLSAARRT
jgi:predicted DCC family thiol-disulfide oxidoreductase YuxK